MLVFSCLSTNQEPRVCIVDISSDRVVNGWLPGFKARLVVVVVVGISTPRVTRSIPSLSRMGCGSSKAKATSALVGDGVGTDVTTADGDHVVDINNDTPPTHIDPPRTDDDQTGSDGHDKGGPEGIGSDGLNSIPVTTVGVNSGPAVLGLLEPITHRNVVNDPDTVGGASRDGGPRAVGVNSGPANINTGGSGADITGARRFVGPQSGLTDPPHSIGGSTTPSGAGGDPDNPESGPPGMMPAVPGGGSTNPSGGGASPDSPGTAPEPEGGGTTTGPSGGAADPPSAPGQPPGSGPEPEGGGDSPSGGGTTDPPEGQPPESGPEPQGGGDVPSGGGGTSDPPPAQPPESAPEPDGGGSTEPPSAPPGEGTPPGGLPSDPPESGAPDDPGGGNPSNDPPGTDPGAAASLRSGGALHGTVPRGTLLESPTNVSTIDNAGNLTADGVHVRTGALTTTPVVIKTLVQPTKRP